MKSRVADIEQAGRRAVQMLRKETHEKGFAFMINSTKLPAGQCYLEYPDGAIQLVRINRAKFDFEEVRELSQEEQTAIRNSLELGLLS